MLAAKLFVLIIVVFVITVTFVEARGSVLSSARTSHNRLRKKIGSKPLTWNKDLAKHAKRFANNCDCKHETWNSGGRKKVMKICKRLRTGNSWSGGTNMMSGPARYIRSLGYPNGGWWKSPGHYKNAFKKHSYFGCGIKKGCSCVGEYNLHCVYCG